MNHTKEIRRDSGASGDSGATAVPGTRYDRPIFGGGGKPPARGKGPSASSGPSRRESRPPGKKIPSVSEPVGPGATRSVASRTVAVPRRRRLGLQTQFMLFSLLALLVIGGGAWLYLRPAETVFVLDSYQYTTVGRRDFRDLIVASGTVEPERVGVFAAPVDARVRTIYVEAGEDVAAGTPLLQLASEQLLEDVDKARGTWEEAVLDLEQARLRTAADVLAKEREVADAEQALTAAEAGLPLTRELFELGGVSEREMEDAVAEVARLRLQGDNARQALTLANSQAELALRQAEQKARTAERALAKLEDQLDEMTVRAEEDGRVLSVSVREGQHVGAGTELLRHANVTRQEAKTAVTPDQAARLERGTPGLIRVGGRTIPVTVGFVAPLAQSSGDRAAVPVTLVLDGEAAASLRPFTEVSVELELGVRRDRPALARGPFFASGDASFVYVLSEDGSEAERREVRYGAIDGNFVEVTAGLEPGDAILYSSYTAFRTHPTVELIREGGRPVE